MESFDGYLVDFQNIVSEGLPEMSLKSFRMLLNQHWNTKSIAYHGNPTEGLQIMGLLETRMLDFKNCIVLGLNEGSMPPTNPIQTMIPMDLRNYFGLPTPRDKQGIFAHHFYRLLHRSSNIWITYCSAQDAFGPKEKSRYLMQLELELARNFPIGFNLQHRTFSVPVGDTTKSYEILILKDEAVMERLDVIMSKSVSASLLNKYLTCPLDFYYRYLLEFGEDDSISEEVENSDFGSIIHKVLEDFYRPFARYNKDGERVETSPPPLTQGDISAMIDRAEEAIRQRFLLHFDGDDYVLKSGKNFLSFTMAVRLTKRLLKKEKEFIASLKEPLFIEYLEATFKVPMEIEINGVIKTIQLTGNIDRIDSIGNHIRIIDYKSGTVKSDDVKITKSKSDQSAKFTNKHVLQLMMYAYLFKEVTGKEASTVAILSLINISNGLFELNATGDMLSLKEITATLPERIKQIVQEMYNTNTSFGHDSESKYCMYCQ